MSDRKPPNTSLNRPPFTGRTTISTERTIRVVSGARSNTTTDLAARTSPVGTGLTIGQRQVLEDPHAKVYRGEELLEGNERQRVLNRLLGKFDDMPPIFDPTAEGARTRAYIPGLWNHGTIPAFIGPKGWGKTKFLCRELVPALVIPGRQFLGHFEPVEMTDDERQRDIWLINSETRPSAVHEELEAAGLVFARRDGVPCYISEELGLDGGVLIVEHLMTSGGATSFDLTDDAKRDYWQTRLVELTNRHAPPITVIGDGMTAMMRNDTARSGAMASAFRSLLRETGIPNGIGVLHSPMDPRTNTPMGGLESMAEWDGQWIAEADRFPIHPSTARHFLTLPRLGDPVVLRRRVVLHEDGALEYDDVSSTPRDAVSTAPPRDSRRAHLREALSDGAWHWTKAICGTGAEYTANKKALEGMERGGEVITRGHSEGKTRGYQWRLVGANSDAA